MYSLYGVMDLLGFFHLVREERCRAVPPVDMAEGTSAEEEATPTPTPCRCPSPFELFVMMKIRFDSTLESAGVRV